MLKKRTAVIERKTKETSIKVKLNIDGTGESKINTSIGILNHMLELFAFHGLFDLEIVAKGDLKVDLHHTNEDVGIALGQAFKKALGSKTGIVRNGFASFPMEEVIANVTVDISGRGYFKLKPDRPDFFITKAEYNFKDAEHFFEAFSKQLGLNLIIELKTGTCLDLHTILEPIFKALGKALDQATQIDPRRKGIPSTKGIID